MNSDRLPPHSPASERSALAICCDEARFISQLEPDWFYETQHRLVVDKLKAAESLLPGCKCVDIGFLDGELTAAGVEKTLLPTIMADWSSPENWPVVTATLRDLAVRRKLIRAASEQVQAAFEVSSGPWSPPFDIAGAVGSIQRAQAEATEDRDMNKACQDFTTELEAAWNGQKVPGIMTGYPDMDFIIGGLFPGQLMILAARPAVGKSSLAVNIAEHISIDHKRPVGLFTLEMSEQEIVKRIIHGRARVERRACEAHAGSPERATERQLSKVALTTLAVQNAPLRINDKSGISISELFTAARLMREKQRIELLILDYLGLVRCGDNRKTRYEETTLVSNALKGLAKELGIPVLALAQLNRSSEKEGRAPMLSDLRDSGAIEQDADVVALLYRKETADTAADEVEMFIAKNRNGRTGHVKFTFLKNFTRFESAAKIDRNDNPSPRYAD